MAEYDFDLFTIGAGSGGVAGTRRAAAFGARTAICEAGRIGGTCVLRGCVPKKLLVYATRYAHDMEDARGFGWHIGEARLDWGALIGAKNRELERLEGIYRRLLRDSGVTTIEGRGRIVAPHTVQVGEQTYTAKHIMVATGGRPRPLDIPGCEHAITSREALDLEELPRSILIVGGGYIAVEFASIFNAAGVDVTLVVRSNTVLRGFDTDVRTCVDHELGERGIELLTETRVRSIEPEGGGYSVRLSNEELLNVEKIMFATGRVPNVENLGLEEVGVALGENGGIIVDSMGHTTNEHILAVGDVTNRINLTPVAIRDARGIAETLFNDNPTRVDHGDIPTAVFCQPPVGTVGLTEVEARRQTRVDVYQAHFRPMKATLSGRKERVLIKLIVDRESDVVLGCHIVGDDAPEIIQAVAIAIKAKLTKKQFDATTALHPSTAEELVLLRDPIPDPEEDVCA